MAKAAYGRPTLDLAVVVETMQDLWIVRIGPDADGATESYLITEWDERAEVLVAEIEDRANLDGLAPNPRPSSARR